MPLLLAYQEEIMVLKQGVILEVRGRIKDRKALSGLAPQSGSYLQFPMLCIRQWLLCACENLIVSTLT